MAIQAIGSSTAANMATLAMSQTNKTNASTNTASPTTSVTQTTAKTPPAGGGGGAKPAASGGSNTSVVYDPADTNKDGVVSLQEKLQYYLKQSAEENSSSTTNTQTQTGLNAYQGQQSNGAYVTAISSAA